LDEGERLQKTLARAGFGSRRACEILISERRVTIDGRVAELGNRVDPDLQVICVDGSLAPTAQNTVYFLLHKPDGVVGTRLVRTRSGPIQDATLSPGASRQLSLAEVRRLMEAVGMSEAIASTCLLYTSDAADDLLCV